MSESDFMRAALGYAAAGWAVFPCQPRAKTPITRNGFKDASHAAVQVRAWWTKDPTANVGIATGTPSGFFVVDIDVSDGKPGRESLATLEREHGPLPTTQRARTGSGGEHLLFSMPDGLRMRSTTGALGTGIDTRGNGGYVVAAPSVHPSGKVYEWLNEAPIAAPPAWLVDLLTAKTRRPSGPRADGNDDNGPDDPELREPVTIEPPRTPGPKGSGERYVAVALEREAANVANAKQGTRNATLNRAAYSMGQLVGGGAIGEAEVIAALNRAALACGLEEKETGNAIRSGLTAGKAKPRYIPKRPARASTNNGHNPSITDANTDDGEGAPDDPDAGDLPEIRINGRPMRNVSRDALAALHRANDPPRTFVRAAKLTRVVPDEKNNPRLSLVGEDALRGLLCRAGEFVTITKPRGGDFTTTPADPPISIVKDILALPGWHFPPLIGLIEAPALRPDGSILFRPGYDAATGLFHHALPGLIVPPVPDHPTAGEVSAARARLLEPLEDFLFDSDASRANALALMLTPIYRPAIAGNVPLALIDSPQAGSGKSLLAGVVNALYAGNPDPSIITAPKDDNEWRKRITAILMAGAPIINIDNLSGTLSSPALCAALTASTWEDRVMGLTAMIKLPQRATWIATGNNVTLAGDMPRRCFWIRIDPKMSRPFQRDDFKHADLIAWVLERRGEMIAAALTLARAWISAGRPSGGAPRIGSYNEWARVLGGVLSVAGVPGYLANLTEMLDNADEDAPQWEAFLVELSKVTGGRAAPFAELWEAIGNSPELIELIPTSFDAPTATDTTGNVVLLAKFRRELAYAFRTRKGTRYGDSHARIEQVTAEAGRAKVALWRIMGTPSPLVPFQNAGDGGDTGDITAQTHARENTGAEAEIDGKAEAGMGWDMPRMPRSPAIEAQV